MLRVPGEPHDPAGAPGTLRVFKPAKSYFKYRMALWGLGQFLAVYLCLAVGSGVFFVGLALLSHFAPGPGADVAGHRALASLVTPHAWKLLVTSVVLFMVALVTAQALFTFAMMNLDFALRWYKVTDRSLRIREGVWSVRELTMSFANIQNISVTQGPVQRFFGVSDLVVESAGGGAVKPGEVNLHTGYFRGVENAEEIKAMMLARLRELKHLESEPAAHAAPATLMTAGALSWIAALREVRDEARALRLRLQTAYSPRGGTK